MNWLFLGFASVLAVTLVYRGHGYWAWVLGGLALLPAAWSVGLTSTGPIVLGVAFAALALVFGLPALRRQLVTRPLMPAFASALPRMGDTERVALDAGTVWWDGDLFSGDPDWRKLLAFEKPGLSEREKVFLDGPVEELCGMLNDWEITQARRLPTEAWEFMKKHRFLGMIIPEEHGGLGFSARAHSAVVIKVSSRSVAAGVTVMVPNSLGPAELLLHYGTEEQKRYYLPRLALGKETPCFALTGPESGSDAAATQSVGIVCRDQFRGEDVLGMRLNWNKRYITLGPVATVIGLAFRLKDPDGLLGGTEDLGITCALIPADLPGVEIGDRHDPMGVPFQNGPNYGHDVFVPLDFIIGGKEMAGKGWRMLMESLAAGRGISLPSLSVGAAELATRLVSAYATVREQFDTPIGRFEGIEEPLARIGGLTYLMNAARELTVGAIDSGEKPAVITAIVKAYLTEAMRDVVNDAMDIRAGAAISRGPRNTLEPILKSVPIAITVEGANILTRSMIIYGQGAIRCHPYVREEMQAVAAGDLARFDRAFFKHIGFACKNATRAFLLALTAGKLARTPGQGRVKIYFQRLSRMSSAFAIVSGVAMATLGGRLKRREKISARLADVLAWMYLASAALKQYFDAGRSKQALPFVSWSCEHALFEIQRALLGILDNLPSRPAAWLLRILIFPLGPRRRPPSDRLGGAVARELLEDRAARHELTKHIYKPPAHEPGLGKLEAALEKAVAAHAVETKIRDAVRSGLLDRAPGDELLELALDARIITEDERQTVLDADEARAEVIEVDAFDPETFLTLR